MFEIKKGLISFAALLTACATPATTSSIFYKSQADSDVALSAFEEENPSCQLWTNWQTACFKSPDGKVHCGKSGHREARASKPFCVVRNGQEQVSYIDSMSQSGVSAGRFCKRRGTLSEMSQTNREYCAEYLPSRPFGRIDGRFPANAWCAKWISEKRGKHWVPQCVSIDLPPWCKTAALTGVGLLRPSVLKGDEINTAAGFVPNTSPVTLVYCVEEQGR